MNNNNANKKKQQKTSKPRKCDIYKIIVADMCFVCTVLHIYLICEFQESCRYITVVLIFMSRLVKDYIVQHRHVL